MDETPVTQNLKRTCHSYRRNRSGEYRSPIQRRFRYLLERRALLTLFMGSRTPTTGLGKAYAEVGQGIVCVEQLINNRTPLGRWTGRLSRHLLLNSHPTHNVVSSARCYVEKVSIGVFPLWPFQFPLRPARPNLHRCTAHVDSYLDTILRP